MSIAPSLLLAIGIFSSTLAASSAQESVFIQTQKSVVEILATGCKGRNQSGSGFIWSSTTVVSALHVISGCQSVSVRYQKSGEFSVSLVRYDKSRDLVELKVTEILPGPALRAQTNMVKAGEQLLVVGFPEQIASADSVRLQVTDGMELKENRTLRSVLRRQLHSSATAIGLDLGTDIIRVSMGLSPGTSGSPVVKAATGELVGVAHGRAAEGILAIGWVSRASYLDKLSTQPWVSPASVAGNSTSFFSFASFDADKKDDGLRCGQLTLRYRWRRSLSDVLQTHWDAVGVKETFYLGPAMNGVGLDVESFKIWQEEKTGGYIAIPATFAIRIEADKCVASSRDAKTSSRIEILGRNVDSEVAAIALLDRQQQSVRYWKTSSLRLTGGKLFSRPREHMTNGALVDVRSFRAMEEQPRELLIISQTSFIRNGNLLSVVGWASTPTYLPFRDLDCKESSWDTEDCRNDSQVALEAVRATLAAALSTVPEW